MADVTLPRADILTSLEVDADVERVLGEPGGMMTRKSEALTSKQASAAPGPDKKLLTFRPKPRCFASPGATWPASSQQGNLVKLLSTPEVNLVCGSRRSTPTGLDGGSGGGGARPRHRIYDEMRLDDETKEDAGPNASGLPPTTEVTA